jgi:hypothetical protein
MNRARQVIVFTAALLVGALTLNWIASQPADAAGSKIRRTIMLSFKPEATAADIQKVLLEVRQNVSGMQGVRNVIVGAQINVKAPFSHGISMDFDDENALKAYRQNEEHRRTHNDYTHFIDKAQITDIRDE